jgi:hypothetical protein
MEKQLYGHYKIMSIWKMATNNNLCFYLNKSGQSNNDYSYDNYER